MEDLKITIRPENCTIHLNNGRDNHRKLSLSTMDFLRRRGFRVNTDPYIESNINAHQDYYNNGSSTKAIEA